MTGKRVQCLGLFLATFAAFLLALGQPGGVLGDTGKTDLSAVEKFMTTKDGSEALAKAGISVEKLQAMLAELSPEQRASLEKTLASIGPKVRLGAKMEAAGYSKAEANERLALLSDAEIAKLAADPEGMTSGGFIAVLAVLIMVAAIWYFVVIEDPGTPPPAPQPEPPPAK